ncbi:YkgJ family cysteine cluster protein [Tropicibacter sp. R16_0]|uniref:YkgJ family cysteine cluster protein n=1 Tax=Tropicibacter sp. R16_0 TaxID=2821102 RepID=UPI001ADD2819|nr:YkgJ family cysteine cluster protein [Tropicibacter sp. R16_0]MBO9449149.1 YkgJ family cysteine cluster protein [Tropicibacter sp. R16_0]
MSGLCVSCNLCCNGSIFARVPITEEERPRLPKEVQVFARNGALRMRLPCPRLGDDGACTCYDVRPDTCRTYNCKLSKRRNEGEIDERSAVEITQEIKAAQARSIVLAARAMGQGPDAFKGMTIFEVFKVLNIKIKDPNVAVDAYTARRAKLHRNFYVDLVKFHIQSGYWD